MGHHPRVHVQVLLNRGARAEAAFNTLPASGSAELRQTRDRLDSAFEVIDYEACDAVIDDFRGRSLAEAALSSAG